MIRFPKMIYYDIHTHRLPVGSEEVAIVNTIVGVAGEEQPLSVLQSVGIHPWYLGVDEEQLFTAFASLASLPRVVAIGEAGLDKLVPTPLKRQQEIFKRLTLFAEQADRPLLIHCVKAWDELMAIKKEVNPHVAWIIHGFRGNGQLAKQLVGQGFYLSFGERFNPEALHEAWPHRLFAETDNSDVTIRSVYCRIAEALALPLDVVAFRLAQNVQATFRIHNYDFEKP